jgi:plastocyanin
MKRHLWCLGMALYTVLTLAATRAAAEEYMVFAMPENTFMPAELMIVAGDTSAWSTTVP